MHASQHLRWSQARTPSQESKLFHYDSIAERLDDEVGQFARLWFGRTNVGIWRVAMAAEFGEGARVAEVARDVHPDLIPSPSRQAEFWADLGRSLLCEPGTRDKGLAAILRLSLIHI